MIRRTLMLRGYPPEAGLERFGADCGPSASFLGISYLFIFPHHLPRKPLGRTRGLGAAMRHRPARGPALEKPTVRSAPHITSERDQDRKSTRLNSSHVSISYAVFFLKKKNKTLYYTR